MSKTRTLALVVPHPPRALHSNGRGGRGVRFRTAEYRTTVEMLARERLGRDDAPRWPAATVRLTYRFKIRRKRDRADLLAWFKAGFDGLTLAGWWRDDDELTHLPVQVECPADADEVLIEATAGDPGKDAQ